MAALSEFDFRLAETINEVVQSFSDWIDCDNTNSTLVNGLPKVQIGDKRVEAGNFQLREKATGKVWPNYQTYYKTPAPDSYFGTKTGKTLLDYYPLPQVNIPNDEILIYSEDYDYAEGVATIRILGLISESDIIKVDLYEGDTFLGTQDSDPIRFDVLNPTSGTHYYHAILYHNDGSTSVSNLLPVFVQGTPPPDSGNGTGLQVIDISATTVIPFNNLTTNIAEQTVIGPVNFTVNTTGAKNGFNAIAALIADGVNVPTFTGFEKINDGSDYVNTAGVLNMVSFYRLNGLYWYSFFQKDTDVPNDGGGNTGNTTPAAPTNGVVDDTANTFTFTPSVDAVATEHEYSLNGAGWVACASNVINVGNIAVAIGSLLVRVKAATGRNVSASLANATAFTVANQPGTSPAHESQFTGSAGPITSYVPEIGEPWVNMYAGGTMGLDGLGNVHCLSHHVSNSAAIRTPLVGTNFNVKFSMSDISGSLVLRLRQSTDQLTAIGIQFTTSSVVVVQKINDNDTLLLNTGPPAASGVEVEVIINEGTLTISDNANGLLHTVTIPQVFAGNFLQFDISEPGNLGLGKVSYLKAIPV